MGKTITLLVLLAFVAASGCVKNQTTPATVCNPPYIHYAQGCCMDSNENNICDRDEAKQAIEQETTINETTIPTTSLRQTTTVRDSTTSLPEETTTTTTIIKATTTSLPPREIIFKKDGDYRVTMTFMGVDGKTHTAYLDSGPFEVGDEFLMNGRVFEYYEYYDETESAGINVELKDISSFDRKIHQIVTCQTPLDYTQEVTITTHAFLDAIRNDEEIEIQTTEVGEDDRVLCGTIEGIPVILEDGTLYLGVDGHENTVIGLNADVAGLNQFREIQLSPRGVGVSIIAEDGMNLNGAKGDVTDDDSDDVFIVVHDPGFSGGKRIYIDFYDRNYRRGDYTNSVKVASSMATGGRVGKTFFDMDTKEETYIENFPLIAYKYNITYRNGNEITQVRVHT